MRVDANARLRRHHRSTFNASCWPPFQYRTALRELATVRLRMPAGSALCAPHQLAVIIQFDWGVGGNHFRHPLCAHVGQDCQQHTD